MKFFKKIKPSFILSFSLHAGLLLILSVSFSHNIINPQINNPKVDVNLKENTSLEPAKKIISAGVVDKNLIEDAIKRQKQDEIKKQQELRNQTQQLAKAREDAKKAEQAALKIKKEAEKYKQQVSKIQQEIKQEKLKAQKAKEEALKAKNMAKESADKALKAKQEAELAEKKRIMEEKKAQEIAAKIAQEKKEARQKWLDQEFARYAAKIKQDILNNRSIITSAFEENLVCEIRIKLLPNGDIQDVAITKSSGNVAYDNNSKTAVYKASPFEMPSDIELNHKLRDIILVFKPEETNV